MKTELAVAILAGGLATRMKPLTETIPKALLPVAGKPFIRHQLVLLKKNGAQRIVLCLGHLGERIEQEIGDGADMGLSVRYSYDGPKLLGTGGALRRALPLLGESFFVIYGDSYLPIALPPVEEVFVRAKKVGLMTVYRNDDLYDASNIWFEDGIIKEYDKKNRRSEMRHIDYGLGLLKAECLARFEPDEPFDLASVYRDLLRAGQLAAYETHERFYEIGSPAGLAELNEKLQPTHS